MGSIADLGQTSLSRDRFHPLVVEAVDAILAAGDVVTPLDVLLRLEVVTPDLVAAWRAGGVPYLERGMTAGLSRVGRILRLLREHALTLGLSPVPGKYKRRGKKARLRFTKSNDTESEEAYACHFVRTPPAGKTP